MVGNHRYFQIFLFSNIKQIHVVLAFIYCNICAYHVLQEGQFFKLGFFFHPEYCMVASLSADLYYGSKRFSASLFFCFSSFKLLLLLDIVCVLTVTSSLKQRFNCRSQNEVMYPFIFVSPPCSVVSGSLGIQINKLSDHTHFYHAGLDF